MAGKKRAAAPAAPKNDDELEATTDAAPAANVREYMQRIGKSDDSRVTFGELAGVLEYFALTKQPDDHAPSPHA